MSTPSSIALHKSDGTVKQVYCNYDGYIKNGVGEMLKKYYKTEEKIEDLMNMGNISGLGKSIECPEGHSFHNRLPGYSVFYIRDRSESFQSEGYNKFESEQDYKDFIAQDLQDFNYYFDGEVWRNDGKKF